jgi:MFS family permease
LNAAVDSTGFPKGVNYLFAFFFFNFVSVMIVMETPIFLYAASLDASATVVGLIAGLTPIMVIFQIPAADHVSRVGYKRFITIGWTIRLLFVLPLIAVPLLHENINKQSQLALVVGSLFCFNLIRGIASTGWYPWITGLITKNVRGRYLSRETASNNIGSLVALLIAALYLGKEPGPNKFAVLFAFSLVMGLVSLWFIHRVPDAPVTEENANNKQPVPWRAILEHRAFQKLLWVSFTWAVLIGGLMGFMVKFLKKIPSKEEVAIAEVPEAMADNLVLYASAAKFAGGLVTFWFLHSRLDRLGSRPLMFLALGIWAGVLMVWIGMSGGKLPVHFWTVCGAYLVMGFAFAIFYMSLTKLVMATVPEMGKSHFFALYSVVGSLAVGVFPILWGVLIDTLAGADISWMGLSWNQYSIYFTALLVVLGIVTVLVMRLEEKQAVRVNELLRDLIRHNPLRDWLRR